MKRNVLIIIDMQEDFVYQTLGTDEAKAIVPAVVDKAKHFEGELIFTQDTHHGDYSQTQEGKFLPVPHCIVGSKGWDLIAPLKAIQKERSCAVYQKTAFGSTELALDLSREYMEGKIGSIELCGVCTDICVVSNALLLKAFIPEAPIIVNAACCAGVTTQKHEAALEVMRSCQIILR